MAVTALLVGNSRLHWGLGTPQSSGPGPLLQHWDGDWPPWQVQPATMRWAAVGLIPPSVETRLGSWPPPVETCQMPLANCPAHVGVDRALGGWQAFGCSAGGGVLVVDAGTALTMTAVTSNGSFAGGRILPGVALQLESLHQRTASLPCVVSPQARAWPTLPWNPAKPGFLATDTVNAMVDGVIHGLSAAVVNTMAALATAAVVRECWLTGGDAPLLQEAIHTQLAAGQLASRELALHHDPHLVLKGLLRLRTRTDGGGLDA
ncbi:Pantothenate kinase type III, CoaX-like (EC 2.7.1.33) [Candidatus Synechococcus spongiarum]|uniref:Type III pantothenate kinase n=2 Tax=Candidatus Synechococcus spongiarum TaxID=431041 RepID=A0A164ZSE9_9SYNE|nr:Pantothenate kinase type III, CoaX-like (EC 2.7.1.33) [Candidatus Synechococcus spongiarum]